MDDIHSCGYYCTKPECIKAQRNELRDKLLNRNAPMFESLQNGVIDWASERDIYKYSNPRAQLLKAISEIGELADAEAKNDLDGIKDAVGDTVVCLINYCHLHGLNIPSCLEVAYAEILPRKGRMIEGGVFVKDEA